MNTSSRWLGSALAACALLLSACGGGGGDDATPADAVAGTQSSSGSSGSGSSGASGSPGGLASPQGTTSPGTSPGTTTQDADGNPFTDPAWSAGAPIAKYDCGIANLGRDIVNLLNEVRARGASCGSRGVYAPAGPLAWNAQLEGAAAGHSQDMADNNLFSHVGSGGQTLAVRVDATGYHWVMLGENIAAGYDTPAATVQAWMASDGHCANVMNGQFEDIALACVPGNAATSYRNYWTLDFGRPR
jgi:uncharacterized protein YkwD